MIHCLFHLLLFQALGEVLSAFVIPFIPGPVVGLVLLLAFLGWRGRVPAAMDQVGSTILQHLAVSMALVLSVVATTAVTALVLKWLAAPRAQDEHAP